MNFQLARRYICSWLATHNKTRKESNQLYVVGESIIGSRKRKISESKIVEILTNFIFNWLR